VQRSDALRRYVLNGEVQELGNQTRSLHWAADHRHSLILEHWISSEDNSDADRFVTASPQLFKLASARAEQSRAVQT